MASLLRDFFLTIQGNHIYTYRYYTNTVQGTNTKFFPRGWYIPATRWLQGLHLLQGGSEEGIHLDTSTL